MKRLNQAYLAVTGCALAAALFAGCSGHSSSGGSGGGTGFGTVGVQVTDAPFPFESVASAKVTITEITLHGSGTQGFATVFTGTRTLDLVQLQNGVTAALTSAQVPTGTYSQMRVVLDSAEITLTDGRKFDLKTPSAETAGLKVFISPPLTVESGVSKDLLLDIDLSQSFSAVPNSATKVDEINSFIFHPVVRVSNLSTVGRITGKILDDKKTEVTSDDTPLADATVTVKQNGTVIGTAKSTADGSYAILGLSPGTYEVTAEKTGYQSATVTSQSVSAGSFTAVDVRLSPN
jgi:hypothetical protein